MAFSHEPLADNTTCLRLVSFGVQSGPCDPPQLNLKHYQLSSDVEYDALSYEWGSRERIEVIYVDYRPFLVRSNLLACLKELHARGLGKPMFIDAICIDQSNIEERNAQVQMMADIYKSARHVIVWLGTASARSDLLFDICNSEDAMCAEVDYWKQGHQFVGINTFELADSLDELLSRSYWSRLWIIQEIYFARRPVFVCGSRWMTLLTLRRLCDVAVSIWARNNVRITDRWDSGGFDHLLTIVHMRRELRPPGGSDQLYLQVLDLKHCKCLDVKDKVYGVLGMHLDWTVAEARSEVLKVDYEAPVEILYMRLLASISPQIDMQAAQELLRVFDVTDGLAEMVNGGDIAMVYHAELDRLTFNIELLYVGTLERQDETISTFHDTVAEAAESHQIYALSELVNSRSSFANNRPQEFQRLQRFVCVTPQAVSEGREVFWITGTQLVIMTGHATNRGDTVSDYAAGVLADRSQESYVSSAVETLDEVSQIGSIDTTMLRKEQCSSSATSLNTGWHSLSAILLSGIQDRPATFEYMELASSIGSGSASPDAIQPGTAM